MSILVQRGPTPLKKVLLASVFAAPFGWAIAFLALSVFLGIPLKAMLAPFVLCWLLSIAVAPWMYWTDKRSVETANPVFVVLKVAPLFLAGVLVVGYLTTRQGGVLVWLVAMLVGLGVSFAVFWRLFRGTLRRALESRQEETSNAKPENPSGTR